ncbi:TatD family hydrolase [Pelobacter propionicus]|uniref:Hydrolase, TatD family n=1 Tax=Pelobacter propionicus (strain DSM 2379 / NBRC 103807 / OttBd1) TaxID=338966 RepID=A1AV27_PELPD|nr:TatD family hydrolase [Pelobacter propionicus]ABL01198.1 hydrolase, TatD family [Pelobacter propionicus DSM 2379]
MNPQESEAQIEDGIRLLDTHCHLNCEPLLSNLPGVLEAAHRAGVVGCVVPGVHPADWELMAGLTREHAGLFPAFGIHPLHADLADGAALERLAQIAASGVALGEIGLDPTYPGALDRQEQAFREQLRLAIRLGLPVLVHCRRLFQRTLTVLREEKAGRVGGIMHAFSGSPEMAREFIRLGFAISLCGTVTWRGAARPVRLAGQIPLESLVLETDAPDMAPEPFRGESNRPSCLREVLVAVAGIRDMLVHDLARATTVNTLRVLGRITLP